MLLGFISLLLTVLQDPISRICVPKNVGSTWHPCKNGSSHGKEEDAEDSTAGRKLLQFLDSGFGARRILATKGYDKCTVKVGLILFLFNHLLFKQVDSLHSQE